MNRPSPLISLAGILALVIVACPARAQQQNPPPQPPPAPQTAPAKAKPDAKKPKKVWTNDSMQDLSSKSGVSVVGDGSSGGSAGLEASERMPTAPAGGRNAEWYRQQLAPLHAEIDRLDAEIKKMKDFRKDGSGSTGGVDISRRGYSISPENNIQVYEKRKKQLQDKIDALEDQARKDGISPGDLR